MNQMNTLGIKTLLVVRYDGLQIVTAETVS